MRWLAYARVDDSATRVARLVLVTKGRLLRVSGELLFRICEFSRVEVVVRDRRVQR
jgi:hypothetical protein